jgi:hypothetical protein
MGVPRGRAVVGATPYPHPKLASHLSHFFSATSFDENYKSFLFINIVSSPETDIFSTCVFNNILLLSFIFGLFYFSAVAPTV